MEATRNKRLMVTERTQVVVYGRSLYMAGLATSLKAAPLLQVVCRDPSSAVVRQALDELAPAAIAFDLVDLPAEVAFGLVRDRPGILLVGVDPARDDVLVLTGHHEQAMTTADLVELLTGSREFGVENNRRPVSNTADQPIIHGGTS